MLVHVAAELGRDTIEPVEVLGARAQVCRERRVIERLRVEEFPDVVRRERLRIGRVPEHALQRETGDPPVAADVLDHVLGQVVARSADAPSAGPEEIEDEQEDEDKEEVVLKLIDKLDKNKKGAPLADLVKEAAKAGIGEPELEEINNSLLDKGLIYEPTIGKMKRI